MNKTENLNLNKYDPIADAKEPFSISDGLNANWDIIDSELVKNKNGSASNLVLTGQPALKIVTDNNVGSQGENLGDIYFTYQGVRLGMIRARNFNGIRNLDLTVMDENDAFRSTLSLQTSSDGSTTAIKAPASSVAGSICTTVSLSKSSNGYVKFGNGVILQWGNYSMTSSPITLKLPVSFSSASTFSVCCTDGGSARYAIGVVKPNGSNITIYSQNATNGGLWLAVGY